MKPLSVHVIEICGIYRYYYYCTCIAGSKVISFAVSAIFEIIALKTALSHIYVTHIPSPKAKLAQNTVPQGVRNGLINSVDVLGEPIQDTSQGRGVKERHGGPKDVCQHVVMETRGGEDASDGQGE